jgi:hypothetical protein
LGAWHPLHLPCHEGSATRIILIGRRRPASDAALPALQQRV